MESIKLSESKESIKKFTEVNPTSKYSILTEEGYKPIISSNKTIEYDVYEIKLEDGMSLKAADNHILITQDYTEIFAVNSLNSYIRTKKGIKKVISIELLNYKEEMYDLSIDSENHTYYTNDILSHNTISVSSYILWKMVFGVNTTHGVVGQVHKTAIEVLDKIKEIMFGLPFVFLPGIKIFNRGTIYFDNKCRVLTATANGNAFRGFSIIGEEIDNNDIPSGAVLYIDECIESKETITIRNKKTKLIETLTIGEFNDRL